LESILGPILANFGKTDENEVVLAHISPHQPASARVFDEGDLCEPTARRFINHRPSRFCSRHALIDLPQRGNGTKPSGWRASWPSRDYPGFKRTNNPLLILGRSPASDSEFLFNPDSTITAFAIGLRSQRIK
jgi:hypothetical protein